MADDSLFPGFKSHWLDGEGGRIFARTAGSGPPLVLVHGFPQTHAMWHKLAPRLSEAFSVVCLDLRGYGWSGAPDSTAGALYAKREMGKDIVRIMEDLGHVRFAYAGHDRGARVGYRLALDHPGRITRLALLDILPTYKVWQNIRSGAAPGAHWEFLARPAPEPEGIILKDPIGYIEGLMTLWTGSGDMTPFDTRARASYRDSANDPSRIHAYCEDYRAGATLDLDHDEADLAAKKQILCPTLILWGAFYLTGKGADPLQLWRESFAPKAQGVQVKGGHFIAEEDPDGVYAALLPFLQGMP